MDRKLNQRQRMQIRIRKLQMKQPPVWLLIAAAVILLAGAILFPQFVGHPAAAATMPTDDGSTALVMDFVGDVMLDRNIRTLSEKNGYASLFDGVRGCWQNADLVFANLESSVVDDDTLRSFRQTDATVRFACSYDALSSAKDAGLNMFCCANDHSADYGTDALAGTLEYFRQTGTAFSGIGSSSSEAAVCRREEINGYTVAFLSVADVYAEGTSAGAARSGVLSTNSTGYFEAVYNASSSADLTVVYVHWGEENSVKASEEQETIAHRLIEAGANIVIGSHPHVLQKTELYRNGIIFYSLGNFIFDQGSSFTKDSVMVQFTLDQEGNGLFELVPIRAVDGIPYETDSNFYRSRINRELTQGLDKNAYYTNELGHIMIPAVRVVDDPFSF